MSYVSLPQRFLAQPQSAAVLNPAWVNRGLTIACNPAFGAINLASRQFVTNSGGMITVPTNNGPSWRGATGKYIDFGAPFAPGAAGCTVLQIITPGSVTNVFPFTNRAASVNAGIEVLLGAGGVAGLARVRMHSPEVVTTDLTGLNDGRDHTLVVRFTPSTELRLWADVFSRSVINTTSIPASTTSTQNMRLHNRGGVIYTGTSNLFLYFNNPLPDADVSTLLQNPYIAFNPAPRRLFFTVAAPGGVSIPVFANHYRNQGIM